MLIKRALTLVAGAALAVTLAACGVPPHATASSTSAASAAASSAASSAEAMTSDAMTSARHVVRRDELRRDGVGRHELRRDGGAGRAGRPGMCRLRGQPCPPAPGPSMAWPSTRWRPRRPTTRC